MSFRRQVALLAACAVALAVLLAAVAAYVTIDRELHRQLDDTLRVGAQQVAELTARSGGRVRPGDARARIRPREGFDRYQQIIEADGTVLTRPGVERLPVDRRARDVAASRDAAYTTTVAMGADDVRMRVAPLPGGGAIQLGRSLAEVDATLDRVRLVMLLVACAGVAMAALLGPLVARRAIEPLRRLTQTAEHVAETRDLGRRIEAGGNDELARLAMRFNEMLDALDSTMRTLDASVSSQRQLIADASHELRTPVTSLRTNIEVLQANPELPAARRAGLLDRTSAQAQELTALTNDLIELARGDQPGDELELIRFDELVEEAIERAMRHAPEEHFAVDLAATTVLASPRRLARAVNNLLDNAVKWNPPGAGIDIRLRDGELTVRDRGPGFDEDELEHVFDRFFRGARSRRHSGSGLGLAIARQVAEAHGGSIDARNAADGGAALVLRFPAHDREPVIR